MSIRTKLGYRCPKCGYAWSLLYTKDYNGTVYCKNNKCNHRFKNKEVPISTYCFYESTTNRDEMIVKVEQFLSELKEFDNSNDTNVCEEYHVHTKEIKCRNPFK